MDRVHGTPHGPGSMEHPMDLVHGPGPWTWSMDQVHGVFHGPRSMFCLRLLQGLKRGFGTIRVFNLKRLLWYGTFYGIELKNTGDNVLFQNWYLLGLKNITIKPRPPGLSRLRSATLQQFLAFEATSRGSGNFKQFLPFRATFEQNACLEHISSAKKGSTSQKMSISANFLYI